MTIPRAALYARVSTDDKGQSPDNQLADLRRFAQAQGWEITSEYSDFESGSKSTRPQFRSMLDAASRREFDLLLFWSLDRLSREGALKTLQILNQLAQWGVAYRSYTEAYLDSAGVFSDAIVALLATLAKQERIRIQERVKAGLDRARREGKRLGRRPTVLRRDVVADLRKSGWSWSRIANELGVHPSAVRRTAKRPGLVENPHQEGPG
ncbi:recombinase family protein [Paludibaculum fermentans]|uniref:recombinase family protein n=1 Tax=Paludibaculum fermentans TaxID=1473598 RepID=UPI003EB8517D